MIEKILTLGSLFDGIGGFPLCAEINGMTPVWASEIEKIPIEITKKHFPKMVHLGDITKIDGAKIQPVDVITFGSPCQDLSTAGKRKGLEGERSGLFRNAIDIIRGMLSSTGGQYPRYAVWENVPGAFSSNKGLDFKTVLEEITKTKIPMPSNGRWAEAGMVECPHCQVAWRVLDAQFWGVPQRRKRIYLVADFGGKRAGKILFECESLRRNPAKSKDEIKNPASYSGTGAEAASKPICVQENLNKPPENCRAIENHATDSRCKFSKNNIVQTLGARMGTGGNNVPLVMQEEIYCVDQGAGKTSCTVLNNKAPTLTCTHGGAPAVVSQSSYSQWKDSGTGLATLKACGGNYGGGSKNLVIQKTGGTLCASDCKQISNQSVSQDKLIITKNYVVRRLTPLECERLQAFPDNWTAGFADAPRYKALGNSLALVTANFVISRIAKELRMEDDE